MGCWYLTEDNLELVDFIKLFGDIATIDYSELNIKKDRNKQEQLKRSRIPWMIFLTTQHNRCCYTPNFGSIITPSKIDNREITTIFDIH